MAVTTDSQSAASDVPAAQSFAPPPPVATFSPPRTWIDPDQSKGWIRRLLPVLRPHRRVLIGAMVAVDRDARAAALHPAGPARRARQLDHGAQRAARPLRDRDGGARHRAIPVRVRAAVRAPAGERRDGVPAAHDDVRASVAAVVRLLRLRAERPAHLACELRHPRHPDVPRLRPDARSLGAQLRRRVDPDAEHGREAHVGDDADAAVRSTWSARGCGSACSRSRGSCWPGWPTSRPSSRKTSPASAS